MSSAVVSSVIQVVLPIALIVGLGAFIWFRFFGGSLSALGGNLGKTTGNVIKGGVKGMSSFSQSMNQSVYGKIAKPKDKFDKFALSTGLGGGAIVSAKHGIGKGIKSLKKIF